VSVPFSIPKVHWGASKAQGTIRRTDDYLILSVALTVLGVLKRPPLTIKVAPEALHAIRYKRGLFHDTLTIRPHGPDLLRTVPGDHEGALQLRVKKEYRGEAERLVKDVRDWGLLHLYDD
jgi:hypothetical protein